MILFCVVVTLLRVQSSARVTLVMTLSKNMSWRLEQTAWIHWKVDDVRGTGGAPRRVFPWVRARLRRRRTLLSGTSIGPRCRWSGRADQDLIRLCKWMGPDRGEVPRSRAGPTRPSSWARRVRWAGILHGERGRAGGGENAASPPLWFPRGLS